MADWKIPAAVGVLGALSVGVYLLASHQQTKLSRSATTRSATSGTGSSISFGQAVIETPQTTPASTTTQASDASLQAAAIYNPDTGVWVDYENV